MTVEELAQRYPNGFADAQTGSIAIDYRNRAATLELSRLGNSPDSPDRDLYQRAVLEVSRFYDFSIEPPDADHLSYGEKQIQMDGLPEDTGKFPLFESLKQTLPAGAFCYRFYVHDWNSFIHIAAENAQFSWIE